MPLADASSGAPCASYSWPSNTRTDCPTLWPLLQLFPYCCFRRWSNDAIGHDVFTGAILLQLYKDIVSVVYVLEGSSCIAHPQLAYATDETLLIHTFLRAKLYPSSWCFMRLHYKRINSLRNHMSPTWTLSQTHP